MYTERSSDGKCQNCRNNDARNKGNYDPRIKRYGEWV
jgi:hypothetical protein